MAKRDETSIGVMCANQPGSWIWDDAHRAALTHLRLLLDVESDPLHFGQYDFRRKQPVQHRTTRRELVQRHRFVDAQRPVRLAHQLPQVAAHGEPVAEVAPDRPQVGAAAASNLDPRHRVRPGSTPVASGSRVPAWPTRWAPVSLRRRLTTEKEVSPGLLSTLSTPVEKREESALR